MNKQLERFIEDGDIGDPANAKYRVVKLGFKCLGTPGRGACWTRVAENGTRCLNCEAVQREMAEYEDVREAAEIWAEEQGWGSYDDFIKGRRYD